MSDAVLVRDPRPDDERQWRRLWAGYVAFYNATVTEEVTCATWRRIHDDRSAVFARVAVHEAQVIGFTICVVHEATWKLTPVCYLEDLFVEPTARGAGVGRALLDDLIDMSRRQGWSRIYWHTRAGNSARRLYDCYALADDLVRYQLAID
jgi:GNAT superfamily N-acetyltransferase